MTLEGHFERVPIDEAYQAIADYSHRIQELGAAGATADGTREIDVSFRNLKFESFLYHFQFSEQELLALLQYSAMKRRGRA